MARTHKHRAAKIKDLALTLTPGYTHSHPICVLERNALDVIKTSLERGYKLTDKQCAALVAGYEMADFSWSRSIQSRLLGDDGQRLVQHVSPEKLADWAFQIRFNRLGRSNAYTLDKALEGLEAHGEGALEVAMGRTREKYKNYFD